MRITPLALGMLTAVLFSGQAALAALEKVGVISLGGTELSAKGADGTMRALKVGDDIFLNDDISNGNAKAQIIFLDRSTLTINADSKVTIDTFVFNPETSTGKLAMTSVKGAMRFVGGHLSKKEPVTIKTPVATIGIRGGIVETHVTGSGATDSVFVYGKEMTMTNQSGQTVSTTTFNTGFNLATGTGTPTALPPAVVNQLLGQFDTSGPVGDNAPSGDDVGNGTGVSGGDAGDNSDGDNSGSGSNSGSGDSSSNSGSGAAGGTNVSSNTGSTNTEVNAPIANPVASPIPVVTNITNNVAQTTQTAEVKQEVTNVVSGTTTTTNKILTTEIVTAIQPAINTTLVSQSLPPLADAGTTTPPPSPTGTDTNTSSSGGTVVDSGTSSSTSSSSSSSGGSTSSSSSSTSSSSSSSSTSSSSGAAYDYRGRYFSYRDDNADAVYQATEKKPGIISVNISGADYTGVTQDDLEPEETVTLPTSWFGANVGLPISDAMFQSLADYDPNEDAFDVGVGYQSSTGLMNYFRFVDNAAEPGEGANYRQGIVQGVFGTTISPTFTMADAITTSQSQVAGGGQNGILFYSFLPNIMEEVGSGQNSHGLFNYNIAAANDPDLTGSPVPLPSTDGLGMAVDWNNRRFVSGYINFLGDDATGSWDTGNSTLYTSFARVAFGSFKTGAAGTVGTAADPHAKGVLLSYQGYGDTSLNTVNPETRYGEVQVGHNVFADGTYGVDGFLLDYEQTDDNQYVESVFDGSPPINGVIGAQAAVREDSQSSANMGVADGTRRHLSTSYKVNAGGLMVHGPDGAKSVSAYQTVPNSSSMNVTADGKVQMNLNVNNRNDYTTAASSGAGIQFGGASVESAYISDKLYAAQMDSAASGAQGQASFIASGGAMMNNTVSECTSCTYTHWGVWGGEFKVSGVEKAPNLIPYVAGREATTDLATKITTAATYTNVNYSGNAYANFAITDTVAGTTTLRNRMGVFNAEADLSNRVLNDFQIDFAADPGMQQTQINLAGGATPAINPSGHATFQLNTADIDVKYNNVAAAEFGNSNVTGGFYGNSAGNIAKEVAGGFGVGFTDPADANTKIVGAGVYHGATTTAVNPN